MNYFSQLFSLELLFHYFSDTVYRYEGNTKMDVQHEEACANNCLKIMHDDVDDD
jgi:hypothetical protein